MIVTGSDYHTVRLWGADGTLFQTLTEHIDRVSSVSWSSDGETIASASDDNTVKLWHKDGTLLKTLEGHNGPVWSVSFSPDGETIASASDDNTVKLWHKDGTPLKTLEGHNGFVWSVSFSPDGETLATGSDDNTVKLWGTDGTLLQTLTGHIRSVSWSPDGETLATASDDGTVKLWRKDGTLLQTTEGHQESVLSVSFSPDGEMIASGSSDWQERGEVKLWRKDGTLLNTINAQISVNSVSFSPDGETIATGQGVANIFGSSDWQERGEVKLWRKDGTLLTTIDAQSFVNSVSFSPDGGMIASGVDNILKIWRKDGTLLHILEGHQGPVWSVNFSPDGQTIVSGSEDGTVKLWRKDGTILTTIDAQGLVRSVSFSPDGQTIVSGSVDWKGAGEVKLWDWNLDRFLAAACYWTVDYRQINTDVAVNDLCQRPEIRAELPDLLRTQALETAKKGNYTAALSFAEDLPDRAAIDTQLRTLASAALREKAVARVGFESLSDLSEIYEDENSQTPGDDLKQFLPLTESRQREGLWLLNRAKSIDPSFDLAQAQQTLEETLEKAIEAIVQNFIDRGDEQAKNGNPDQALQQYRYALQIDPTQGFTPESRLQEQQAGNRGQVLGNRE